MDIQFYDIESKREDGYSYYRYYSLYNGSRGSWFRNNEYAIKEGKKHQQIILMLFGKIIEDFEEIKEEACEEDLEG